MSSVVDQKQQKVILFEENGESLDVLQYKDVPVPTLVSPTDIIVRNRYSGINMIESYFRKGIYPTEKPYILGREASGEIVAVGSDVTEYHVGDKIAYLSGRTFAQYTKVDSKTTNIVKLKPDVTDEELKFYGGLLLQGLTALTFINEAYYVKKGDYILVWAAAGGVGKLLVQLISQRGAHVIAIASTDAKLKLAKELGADYVINSSNEDIAKRVHEITSGKGVQCSFDSIGKDSVDISIDSLARKGTFVSYGNASGPVPPFTISRLSPKNLKLLRPVLFGYISDPEDWKKYSTELLQLIEDKKLKVDITKVYPLSDYKDAAQDLEGRKTTGKLVLKIP